MKAISVIGIVVLVGGGGWLGYDRYFSDSDMGGFVTMPLTRGDVIKTVSATGTIEPLVKVIIGSEVSGKIKKWYADFNTKVTAGFVLAEIDPARIQTAHDQASADLALARAREEEARVRHEDALRERKRIQTLYEQHNASENELQVAQAEEEAVRAAWHGTQASVESAEAALSAVEVDLERTVIRSPIDGVVIARNIEDGQTVAASLQAPELFLIANDLRRMQVNANVSESDIGLIREGKPARFRVDAYPNRTFQGTISQIRFNATDVDGVVTYVTLIEVRNDDLSLRPGMTANVTFEVARADDVICIPNAALRFNPNPPSLGGPSSARRKGPRRPTVYVEENDRPVKKEIAIGLSNGSVTALAGENLSEGDLVIIERAWQRGGGRPRDITRSLRRRR
ncbi:MAG: efflux RND transporter periplasmic adaptor subunit [Phycisphaerae bacterium]